jgi:peptidyl-tRNA hydrolase
MKIKAIYVKNLKMPEGKVAAQIAHAVKNLGVTPKDCDIVVLSVSKTKFDELVVEHPDCYVQIDKGLTVVKAGTATAAAWIDQTEIIRLLYDEVIDGMSSICEDALFEYEGKEYKFIFKNYQYMVDEYGIDSILSVSGDFMTMFGNSIFEDA